MPLVFDNEAASQVVLDRCSKLYRSKREVLAQLAAIAAKAPIVQRTLDAFRGKQPKPIALKLPPAKRPVTVDELDPVEREQLVATAAASGATPTAAARLAQARGVAGADDGWVFRAGTTDVVGWLVQDSLDTQGDVALHEALQTALAAPLPEAAPSQSRSRSREDE
jgi:hypothetical protein